MKTTTMDIISNPYPEGSQVGIGRMEITYVQEADTNSPDNNDQTLTISTEDVPGDNEEPYYYNIATTRWSINDPAEIAALVDDFRARLGVAKAKGGKR